MSEPDGKRVIVAGSRDGVRYADVCAAIEQSGFNVAAVVSGGCRGTDRLGEDWANNHDIPVFVYPADWSTHGHAAGPIRNATMANNADALVAIWDGQSRGTKNMIDVAKRKGLSVFVSVVSRNEVGHE